MSRSNLGDFEVTFLHQTEKAVLVTTDGDDEIWIPKSLCEIDPEDPDRGDTITLTCPEYVAIEKGIV